MNELVDDDSAKLEEAARRLALDMLQCSAKVRRIRVRGKNAQAQQHGGGCAVACWACCRVCPR